METRPGAKPETMTQLYGGRLTEKDNPVIVFRGKLDKMAALIMEAQALGEALGNRPLIDDLQEILEFVRRLLSAEYQGTPLDEFRLLGLSPAELRERSHHPEKYFGHKHLPADYVMGVPSIRLNLLRACVRETELAAVSAFRDRAEPSNCRREDIVMALNRLSSLFYILMFKYLPENYTAPGSAGI